MIICLTAAGGRSFQSEKEYELMFKFGSAENSCDKTLATAYIIFMMGGSAFHRCTFRSGGEEMRLRMNYMFMKSADQLKTEERYDRFCSEQIADDVADLNCEVIHRRGKDGSYKLLFYTGIVNYLFTILPGGKVLVRRRCSTQR